MCIRDRDETTQQNAALVEQAAAAAQALQDRAAELARLVSVFRLNASDGVHGLVARKAGYAAPLLTRPTETRLYRRAG